MSTFEAKRDAAGLHPVVGVPKGRKRYCGPSAICLITGLPYTAATGVLKRVTGKRAIMGTQSWDLCDALGRLGWSCRHVPPPPPAVPGGRLTFAHWLDDTARDYDGVATWLVLVTRHYLVVRGGQGGDSTTGGPVPLSELPYRRATVKETFRLDRRLMAWP